MGLINAHWNKEYVVEAFLTRAKKENVDSIDAFWHAMDPKKFDVELEAFLTNLC